MSLPEDIYSQYTAVSLMRLFDLTQLTETPSRAQVLASTFTSFEGGPPAVNCVCTLPAEVKSVKAILASSPQQQQKLPAGATGPQQKVSVALNYPDGTKSADEVCMEAVSAMKDGAQEFECLIDWNAMNANALDGEKRVRLLISELKKVVGSGVIRAVLEVGKLSGGDIIQRAGIAALEGGADFLQTSSGLEANQTTAFAVHLLSVVIDEYAKRVAQEPQQNPLEQIPKKVGIKVDIGPNGTQLEAANYVMQLIFERGADFIHPNTVRIGGSEKLLKELKDTAAKYIPPDAAK